jgi:hypothetical protein
MLRNRRTWAWLRDARKALTLKTPECYDRLYGSASIKRIVRLRFCAPRLPIDAIHAGCS